MSFQERSPGIRIRGYHPDDTAAWDELVDRSTCGTFCHLSGWMRVVEQVWGHRNCSLVAERDGRIRGVLPLFLIRSRLFGTRLVSAPNAVYGGPVADDEATKQLLVEAAIGLATELRADFLELRDASRWESGRSAIEPLKQDLYVTFERPLTVREDDLMGDLPRDVRRMIRLGSRAGLSAERGGANLLDDFYRIYSASLHRLGTPVFPRRLFAGFLDQFRDACDILLVRHDGKVAGAVMNFYFRKTVMPYFGGADPAYYRSGVSNFMYWELMTDAAKRGNSRFDFGRSKRGTGAFEFKRGWGMVPRPLPYRFYSIGGRKVPELNPLNPRFGLMIEIWKLLPERAARLAGPMVVRNLL